MTMEHEADSPAYLRHKRVILWRSSYGSFSLSSLAVWRRRGFVSTVAIVLGLATITHLSILTQIENAQQRAKRAIDAAEGEEESRVCETWATLVNMATTCLRESHDSPKMQQPDIFWNEMDRMLDRCAVGIRDPLRIKILDDNDNMNEHMRFADQELEKSCVSISIGIANTSVEASLRELYNTCEMIAVDPDRKRGEAFKREFSGGKYYPFAISANKPDPKTTDKKGSHRRAENGTDGMSQQKPGHGKVKNFSATMMELATLLRRKKVGSIIDFMRINAKGLEYQLMPYFYRDGVLEREGVSVCQLNMVVHGHPEKLGIGTTYDWRNIVIDFFENSNFLPVWSEKDWPNLKMTFINYADPVCYERFYRIAC